MKILYEIDDTLDDDIIIIKANKIRDDFVKLKQIMESNKTDTVLGYVDKKMYPISLISVEKIFSENRKTYIISNNEKYNAKKKLMDFENINKNFVRISKSCIINTRHLKSIEAEFSGNFILYFKSGNKEYLSRNYVKRFKNIIGMEV